MKIPNPYKIHNDRYKCIFIHIPKAAGISIESALFNEKVGHKPLLSYKQYDEKRFNSYFKFTFVRNPHARVVSSYFFLKNGGRNEYDRRWSEINLSQYSSFKEFVLSLRDKNTVQHILSWQHFHPQYIYLEDSNGKIDIDFTGKVENIKNDFDYVCRKLKIKAQLKHLNKSRHRDYREYYDKQTANIISDLYLRDFKLFNYPEEIRINK